MSLFRSTTVHILKITSRLFTESKSLELRMNYSKAILTLLRDDDSDIREEAATIVIYLVNLTEGSKMRRCPTYQQSNKNNNDKHSKFQKTLFLHMLKSFSFVPCQKRCLQNIFQHIRLLLCYWFS